MLEEADSPDKIGIFDRQPTVDSRQRGKWGRKKQNGTQRQENKLIADSKQRGKWKLENGKSKYEIRKSDNEIRKAGRRGFLWRSEEKSGNEETTMESNLKT